MIIFFLLNLQIYDKNCVKYIPIRIEEKNWNKEKHARYRLRNVQNITPPFLILNAPPEILVWTNRFVLISSLLLSAIMQ